MLTNKHSIVHAVGDNGLNQLVEGSNYTFIKAVGKDKKGNVMEVEMLVDFENCQHIVLETMQAKEVEDA